MQPVLVLELLILLAVANGTPVVAKRLFGGAFAQPLDGGALFADGRPWFGPSKTIRGVVLATLATTAAAAVSLMRASSPVASKSHGGTRLAGARRR